MNETPRANPGQFTTMSLGNTKKIIGCYQKNDILAFNLNNVTPKLEGFDAILNGLVILTRLTGASQMPIRFAQATAFKWWYLSFTALFCTIFLDTCAPNSACAFAVYGDIGIKYAAVGGPSGPLGQPLSDEAGVPEGGRFNDFQHGSIYWHPKTGAHVILGAIRDKWRQPGWGAGWLGYPTTDETTTPDGIGRFNHFLRVTNGAEASIYWTPKTGPVEIYGDIRKRWAQLGWERSSFGYPITPEFQEYQGTPIRSQQFEHGKLWWSPKTGVTTENPVAAYTPPAPPAPQKVKYCTDYTCDACKRDGLRCELNSSACPNINSSWACY
ncbi:hypothetical protein GGD83_001004 [Rhodoblastus sphagnicola]|uniref:LGFP repeat-containing protein n=1 Tax=Rhodoblastus sphagnicola TaxID=333368 RepID=UPI00130505BE|nr:hypothetical protein [Rhodoblastus sphagnicola]MBB4197218.1 hypothetical protein [Rhodoblastus sphagnicola]